MVLYALLGCSAYVPGTADEAACDPRALQPGEVRARQIPCSDELIPGGEGRIGDWLLENAHARYVIRGTYAALTLLREPGGTIVDAASPDAEDVLLEYVPDGDRSEIAAVNAEDEARLELPGVTYRLHADDETLYIEGTASGLLHGRPGVPRTGATVADETGFFGVDGFTAGGGGAVRVEEVTRAALSPERLFPEGDYVEEPVDADDVLVLGERGEMYRLPVVDGTLRGWLAKDAAVNAQREGCFYEGLTQRGCGWLTVRVADDTGADIPALVTDSFGLSLPVPRGGGRVAVGPLARPVWIWAGPRHSVAQVALPGGDSEAAVTLTREVDDEDVILASLSVEVAPDASSIATPEEAAEELAAEGASFVVLVADDEIPSVAEGVREPVYTVAASRAGTVVWSWPWSPNGKRAAHGAVPWDGLGALDLLAASEGGAGNARITVVERFWVERAIVEAEPRDWDPRPDAFYLIDLSSLGTYLSILDGWVDVAAVGPRTWIGVDADRNLPAFEAGIVQGRTTAGNGPRLALSTLEPGPEGWEIEVRLSAPRWMRMQTVTVYTDLGSESRTVEGAGAWKWTVPTGARYVVAVAEGEQSRPAVIERAWAVSAPLWLVEPG